MSTRSSHRSTYLLGLIAIVVLLAISLYLQLVDGILPCPLCTLQRLTFAVLGVVFLLGTLLCQFRSARLIANILAITTSGLGIFLAGRQIWLQHFHTDSSECGVSLQYMIQVLPLNEVLQKVFAGSAECAQRGWEFLSLNMAEWALFWFAGFMVFSFYLLFKGLRR